MAPSKRRKSPSLVRPNQWHLSTELALLYICSIGIIELDSFAAFVDLDHPHFQQFDDDPADLILQDIAAHLIARTTGETPPLSAVYVSLKERYLGSRTIDEAKLDALATQMLTDLKERMVTCVHDNPERPWQNTLNAAER
jgi:hypothetical protein